MKFTLGFSPCPNDTFIFDALVNGDIDTGVFEFDVVMEDVQTLNNWAKYGKLDFSKISYGALPLLSKEYSVLNSGGALGIGVGPLLIGLQPEEIENVSEMTIAIPGENTTAHMLFSLAFPKAKKKVFKVFNEIEDFVKQGKGLGVIIHEGRFTYQKKGLVKLMDLGDYWEKTTGAPIPLGGIIGKRSLGAEVLDKIDSLIRQSVDYSFAHHKDHLTDFVKNNAQEMEESVMYQHINLYVNEYSRALGTKGYKAVDTMLDVYQKVYPESYISHEDIFVH
ncbi:1,4-dihydroxy-6-naphthoate synthase [bacterium A37T11]|nr:1,4-dihydroxy-6-naphthoate synthase [bacterium A37T11]